MKRDTVYKLIIVVLIALNMLQLAPFLLSRNATQPPVDRFQQKAIKNMKLDKQQEKEFLEFVGMHRDKMMHLFGRQSDIAVEYFTQPSDSLLKELATIERDKIEAAQQHFTQIKSILNENQLPLFEQFKQEALHIILEGDAGKEPPRK